MKLFKNQSFIFSFLIVSIFTSTLIVTVDFEEEQPTLTDQPSKSLIDRFKESEFNRRLSSKVNDFTRRTSDFFKGKKNQPTLKPINNFNKTTSSLLDFGKNPTEPVTYSAQDISSQHFVNHVDNLDDWDIVDKESTNSSHFKPTDENKRLDDLEDKVSKMTTPEEIATLTPQDIKDLSIAINQIPAYLISSLSTEQIQNMDIDQILTFDKEQIQNFNIKDLTIQQIKRLVQIRSTGLLQNLTNTQLSSLSSEQIEACLEARPETFTQRQLDDMRNLLRLRDGSTAKIWLKDLTMKNFKNIFKSDKTVLKEFIQDAIKTNNLDKLDSTTVKNAVAKLSRTQRINLFNDITYEELDNQTLGGRSKERASKIFTDNVKLFAKILPPHEMLLTTWDGKNIVSINFKIVDMQEVDPTLSIAENAQLIKESQNLNYNLNDLETQMRKYLESKATTRNLQTLLVDINDQTQKANYDVRDPQIKQKVQSETEEAIEKLLQKNPEFKKVFQDLTAQEMTEITKSSIKNMLDKNTTFSNAHARAIFQTDAEIYQKFAKPNTLIIPIEDASRKNQDSFKFETINISSITDELNQINMANVDIKEYFKQRNANNPDNSPEYNDMINDTGKLINLADKLKREQNLSLNIADIAQEIKNYQALSPDHLKKLMISGEYSKIAKLAKEYLTPEEFEKINTATFKKAYLKEIAFHDALLNKFYNKTILARQ